MWELHIAAFSAASQLVCCKITLPLTLPFASTLGSDQLSSPISSTECSPSPPTIATCFNLPSPSLFSLNMGPEISFAIQVLFLRFG